MDLRREKRSEAALGWIKYETDYRRDEQRLPVVKHVSRLTMLPPQCYVYGEFQIAYLDQTELVDSKCAGFLGLFFYNSTEEEYDKQRFKCLKRWAEKKIV